MESQNDSFDQAMNAYQSKDFKKAIFYFSKCIESNPCDYASLNNRGLIYYTLNEYSNAIKDFNAGIEADSENLELYYNRGL